MTHNQIEDQYKNKMKNTKFLAKLKKKDSIVKKKWYLIIIYNIFKDYLTLSFETIKYISISIINIGCIQYAHNMFHCYYWRIPHLKSSINIKFIRVSITITLVPIRKVMCNRYFFEILHISSQGHFCQQNHVSILPLVQI